MAPAERAAAAQHLCGRFEGGALLAHSALGSWRRVAAAARRSDDLRPTKDEKRISSSLLTEA